MTAVAMPDRSGKIGAIGKPILPWRRHHIGDRQVVRSWRVYIPGPPDLMPHRLYRVQIPGDRRQILVRHVAIGVDRHRWAYARPVRTDAVAHRRDDLHLAPIADPVSRSGVMFGP